MVAASSSSASGSAPPRHGGCLVIVGEFGEDEGEADPDADDEAESGDAGDETLLLLPSPVTPAPGVVASATGAPINFVPDPEQPPAPSFAAPAPVAKPLARVESETIIDIAVEETEKQEVQVHEQCGQVVDEGPTGTVKENVQEVAAAAALEPERTIGASNNDDDHDHEVEDDAMSVLALDISFEC